MFQRSLEFARESGYLQGRKLKMVLDTTPILGRGAVKDTYNLLAKAIKKVVWALGKTVPRAKPQACARQHGFGRYFGSSVKGETPIDWSDEQARRRVFKSMVGDADRLLETTRETLAHVPGGSDQERDILEAAQLLSQLLLQAVERPVEAAALASGGDSGPPVEDGNPWLKEAVARDRTVSGHDREMRRSDKVASQQFAGFKGRWPRMRRRS